MTLPSDRPVYPLRPSEVSRKGDCVTFGASEGWHGWREVEYRGWGRPSPDDDPADSLSENDLQAPRVGLLAQWSGGFESSTHLRLAVAAAVTGNPVPEGTPVPGCNCVGCTGRPALPPLRTQPLRRYGGETLDVEAAREVGILAVCEALGIALRRMGRSYRAPCPVHGGDAPNFSVAPALGAWKCFSCGEGGDSIRLVELMQGVGFRDAVRYVLSVS